MRIGHGFDVHRFGTEGVCRLGGVDIDTAPQLLAHSDGDVVLHAICDALLGAIAAGDIGKHFPDTDPRYKGVDSRTLLRCVVEKVVQQGYVLGNLDVTIAAQKPKISPHIEKMKACLCADLNTVADNINIKATTTEGLGAIGRSEGIAVTAVVLVDKNV